MSRFRLITVALFAMCALGAVASASASAFSYLVLGGFLLHPKENITSINLTEPTLQAPGVEIICKKAKGTGTIELGGLGTYNIQFTECRVEAPANCKVKEPIVVSGTHHLALKPEGTLGVLFLPSKPKNTFVELEFENNGGECALAGASQAVEGTSFGIIENGEAHSLTQRLSFTNASSSLTLAGAKANFKLLQDVVLESDRLWGSMMV